MPKKIQLVVTFVSGGVISVWCLARLWRLRRRALARRRLQELLVGAAGVDARVVITGADSGIGEELARQFTRHPSVSLLLGCRCVERGRLSFRTDSGKKSRVTVAHLELLDFDSVQKFTEQAHAFLAADTDGLRLLVNSAGVMAPAEELSPQGFGVTWQTNFLGPFLLTELLARLRVFDDVQRPLRVVHVSSNMEQQSRLTLPMTDFNDPLLDESRPDESRLDESRQQQSRLDESLVENIYGDPGENAYADSKRAIMLWTSVRAQNLAFTGSIFVHASSPGKVNTSLRRRTSPNWLWLLTKPYRLIRLRTPIEGALAAVAVGLSPKATQAFGRYHSETRQMEDLVVGRMPEKRLAVQLVKWASQITHLDTRVAAYERKKSTVDKALAAKARARA